jgi:DNA-binding transcriptional regulator YiaG
MEIGRPLIDLNGMKFGFLSVVRVDEIKSSRVTNKHMQNAYWICLCSTCGCHTSVRSDYLRNGNARQCFDCYYEAKVRYRAMIRESVRRILNPTMPDDEDQQPNQMKSKKLKIVKRPPSAYSSIVIIKKDKASNLPSIEGKVEVLREKFNTSIKEIAELLGCTADDVREEIKRYKNQ